jgi:predicted RNA-binding Zn ribbon-like protein
VSSSPRAGRLPRIGGALALDFANTTTGRGTDRFVEHLFDYEDLLRWCAANEILTGEAAAGLLARAPRAEHAAAFGRAVALRAVLNTAFDALARGGQADAAAITEIERLARREWSAGFLVAAGPGYAWRFAPADAGADGPLGPVVRSAVAVLTGGQLPRLKACPGEACGWVFLDQTKNGGRVWCEMEVCGTRAKVRKRAQARRAEEAGGHGQGA